MLGELHVWRLSTHYGITPLPLRRGADIHVADGNSYTPLMTAAANGQVSAFRVLKERGARLDVLDRDGKSVAFLAAEGDHDCILKVSEALGLC